MNSIRRVIAAIVAGVVALALLISMPMLVENNDAGKIMVIQSVGGDLSVYTDAGWKWQGFGKVTVYPRRNEFQFGALSKEETHIGPGMGIRFYDGGEGVLFGSISWMMPTDPKSVLEIHKDFGNAEAFEHQAIRRSMESAATFSGPTMSSFESAAGRRNELLQILNDQTLHGVYKTLSRTMRTKDIAGVEKDMTVVEIVKDDKGQPIRAQASYVQKYNVTMLPMTIKAFTYEDRVEKQIREQQAATNQAIVSASLAKKADQDAITAESQGRANAAKAEWEQKTISAKAIADAQAKITIADATVKEAEAFKKAETLRGEGEAARKRAVMEADGQLDKKLEAYVSVNKAYADSISKYQGAWVPSVVMGQREGSGGNGAQAMIDMLSAKTAKELGMDMSVNKGNVGKK